MTKNKQNKLLIIISIITFFLLGQWLWDNVPRYEWQEGIEKRVTTRLWGCPNTEVSCSPDGLLEGVISGGHCYSNFWENDENKYLFCGEYQIDEKFEDTSQIGFCYCYIKEKVRIN